ncbi:MAG: cation:proton antiporter [Candidatus Nanopelagicales bacterium]
MFPQASISGESLVVTEIGALLILLGVLAFLAERYRISVVPLFLLAGLSFGTGGLIPLDLSEEFIDIGATIGALLLLLLLGLEYSARELGASIKARWSAGIVDLITNSITGVFVALLLGWGFLGALVLGGITYISSSGIAAQLIRETGWRKSVVAKRTISLLVVEDLALAPYLPLITALLAGVSFITGLITISLAFVVIGLVLLISVRQVGLLSNYLRRSDSLSLLLTVLGAALLAAGLAESVGLSGAVAAFLVGLLLSGDLAQAARVRLAPLRDLFAAFFFLFFGLTINPTDLISMLPIALVLTIFGVIGKMFTAWWLAKDLSDPMSWRRVGAFLVPRGEFSIVIAGLASTTFFGTDIKALTGSYVILTAIVGSLLIRYYRSALEK